MEDKLFVMGIYFPVLLVFEGFNDVWIIMADIGLVNNGALINSFEGC